MPRIQGHATAQLFQSIYPHDPKIAAGNPAPSPSDDPRSPSAGPAPYTTGRASTAIDRRRPSPPCPYFESGYFIPLPPTPPPLHFHQLLSLPPSHQPRHCPPWPLTPTSPVPPHNLSDHILGPARRLDSHGPTLKRFQPVWITQSPLSCRLSPETEALIWMRFLDGAGRTKGTLKVMIALNLHSSQQVLPVITNPILTSLRYLGAENVYVLEETIWMGVDRIKLLLEYRNQALLAFDNADRALDGLSNLVFIDDVFLWGGLGVRDRLVGGQDATGTVRLADPSPPDDARLHSVVFYDSWVTRLLTGKTLRPRLQILTEYKDGYAAICGAKESKVFQARFHNVLPVPVYLCWNDIVALAPAPFRGPKGLTFRAADRLTNECCNKCLLVPNVAVTYTRIIYYADGVVRSSNCDNRPTSRRPFHGAPDSQFLVEKIDWSSYPKPEIVVCWPDPTPPTHLSCDATSSSSLSVELDRPDCVQWPWTYV
ncbi:hypothetical protein PTTG_26117 [Puccinia triticina 1-1 BBBD Race 1]|uniref:Uncharacterized protein n=1 Tax=Puccinia triticina (isolate 1-1 / race 1 (BBBD)) TaxID=630390 RepID=A0A180GWX6_PUCT1|nr:hypothetical protein PTTG_26117 [Puccinia triticina 1-1 BBBD Race 1]